MRISSDHNMSPEEFAAWGMRDTVYVRPVTINGRPTNAIHAVDGTPLTTIPNRKLAFATIAQHNMTPLSLH